MSGSLFAAVHRARNLNGIPTRNPGRLWNREASEITPRLYLSDLWTACDTATIEKLGITHIISVIELRPPLPESIPPSHRLHITLPDSSDANIGVHLEDSVKWIINALGENESNKVLVHCQQGISRSATIVCAYIIATEKLEAFEAIEYVQERRSIVCPNLGFRLQLVQFSRAYVKAKPKHKAGEVGKEIAQRIKNLFPQKAVKERAAEVKGNAGLTPAPREEEVVSAIAS